MVLVLDQLRVCARAMSSPQYNIWNFALRATGIAVNESSGAVYIGDANKNRIIRQAAAGRRIEIFQPFSPELFTPGQLALHGGLLYVADSSGNRVVVVGDSAAGDMEVKRTIAAPPGVVACSCLAVSRVDGALYVADSWGGGVAKMSADGQTLQWSLAGLNSTYIAAVTLDAADTLYIADSSPHTDRILRVLSNGTVAPPLPAQSNLSSIRSLYWAPFRSADNPLGALYALIQPPLPASSYVYPPTRVVRMSASSGVVEGAWLGVDPQDCYTSVNSWPAALYVDGGSGEMYFSDALPEKQISPTGCSTCCDGSVRRIAADGQALRPYTTDDETWQSLHYLNYDNDTCTLWYAWQISPWESSLVSMAPDGRTGLQSFPTPVFAANRSSVPQHFTLVAHDRSTQPASLVLVAQGNTFAQSHLYRFSLTTQRFTLLDYEIAIRHGSQRPSFLLTGLAVDELGCLYVSVVSDRLVVKLSAGGEYVSSFDTTAADFGYPHHLAIAPSAPSSSDSVLFAVDQLSPPSGRLLTLNSSTGRVLRVHTSVLAPMDGPVALCFDAASLTLFIADRRGHIFHLSPYTDQLLHTYSTVPPAFGISSLTVDRFGSLYALDEFSFRVVVLTNAAERHDLLHWSPSTKACAALPHLPAQHTESLTVWLVCAAIGLLALAALSLSLWTWRRRRGARASESAEFASLLPALLDSGPPMSDSGAVDGDISQPSTASAASQRDSVSPPSTSRRTRRSFSYYVALYEVAAALDEPRAGEAKDWSVLSSSPLSPTPAVPGTVNANSDPPVIDSHPRPVSRTSPTSQSTRSAFSPHSFRALPQSLALSALESPVSPRITSLRSSLQNLPVLPAFVDEVDDLTPLGEGQAGRVFRGFHRGLAVVVKLPKSAEITGAQWREWQAHLRLPAHPHLVTFIGALVMEANNFLVTKLVRQGSLKGLLGDGPGGVSGDDSIYSQPYAVLRAARDLCSALCHMHSHRLVHRDVSARNVLVDSDGTFVLADLGLCREMMLSSSSSESGHQPVTASESFNVAIPVRWTAPEALLSREFTAKSDVWSLGVTLWEMSHGGALPYGEGRQSAYEQRRMIEGIVRGHVALDVHDDWKWTGPAGTEWVDELDIKERVVRIVAMCLTRDVEHRPDSAQLLKCVERELREWEADGEEPVQRVVHKWSEYHRKLIKPCVARQMDYHAETTGMMP